MDVGHLAVAFVPTCLASAVPPILPVPDAGLSPVVLATVVLLVVAACATGVAWSEARTRSAALVAAGLSASCVAAVLWATAAIVPAPVGIPVLAHGLFLVAFPLLLAGLVADPDVTADALRRAIPGLDGVLVVSVVGVAAVTAIDATSWPGGLDVVVSAAYPVGDIARLLVVAVLAAAVGIRRWRLWGVTFLAWTIADLSAVWTVHGGVPRASTSAILLYTFGYATALAGVRATGRRARSDASSRPPGAAGSSPAGPRAEAVAASSATSASDELEAVGRRSRRAAVLALIGLALALATAELLRGVVPSALAAGGVMVGLVAALRVVIGNELARRAARDEGAILGEQHRALLAHAARHDPLTGLPNRSVLGPLERRTGHDTTVLLLDLDGFKAVNDRYGHAVGDDVLRIVAARLDATVREADVVVRLGGDEFVVLATEGDGGAIEALAERLDTVIRRPIEIEGRSHRVGVSIGVARSPASGAALKDLLVRADDAMYAAKRAGEPVRVAPPA